MQLFFLIIGLISTILIYSGFGGEIHLNDRLLYIGYAIAIYFYFIKTKDVTFHIGKLGILISIVCSIMLINVGLNWKDANQLLNFTTLFGLIIGIGVLSCVKWSEMNFFKSGFIFWILAWLLVQLFFPGRVLSGWNPNSSIGIVPCLLCGMCLIYNSDNPRKLIYFYAAFLLTVYVVMILENRSSFVSLLAFGLASCPLIFRMLRKRLYFRILYLSAFAINICTPIFNKIIGQSDIYTGILSYCQQYFQKAGGFSGRDQIWNIALLKFSHSPIFGTAGLRDMYYHNFSCDVLTQFGWLGMITFAIMYCAIMEKCFSKKGCSNIFLLAFSSLLILNTFENALFANGYFTIFPYFLLAIAWQIKYSRTSRS